MCLLTVHKEITDSCFVSCVFTDPGSGSGDGDGEFFLFLLFFGLFKDLISSFTFAPSESRTQINYS